MKKLLLSLILLGSLNSFAQADCASAINITANGTVTAPAVTGTFSNSCYTHATTDAAGPVYGIWYKYTPAANGEVTITSDLPANVAPNSVDTKVSIFTGDCFALTCYDVNDDTSGTNYLSTLTFPVVAGTTYYIQWDNYWDANGFDFTLNFVAGTCIKPYYINAVTNLTATSATLNWDASVSAPANYEVEYGLTGFTQGTGTVATTSTNSITLSGLNASVVYDYYVRSVCDVSTQSAWSDVNNLVLAKVCPYASGFDTTAQLQGWTTAGNSASFGIGTTAANAQSPTQYWIFNTSATAASNNWLISPPFNLQAGEQVTVSFWARCATTRSLRLTVGTANTTTAQTTQIWANPALLATTYTQQTAPAWTAPTAGIYYFAFNDISAAAAVATLRIDTTNFTSVLGTNDFLSSKFSVFPNPTNNVINFSNDQNAVVSAVELADLNGRVVKSEKINATEGQISVSDLATGMYMMKITTDQGVAVKKIVKQ